MTYRRRPERKDREAAVRHYFKTIDRFHQEYIDEGAEIDEVDEDVISLAYLLVKHRTEP